VGARVGAMVVVGAEVGTMVVGAAELSVGAEVGAEVGDGTVTTTIDETLMSCTPASKRKAVALAGLENSVSVTALKCSYADSSRSFHSLSMMSPPTATD